MHRIISNQAFYIFITALLILVVYLLAPILSPFLLGALLAYLTDPLVKRLEKYGVPHLASVVIIFGLLILAILLMILMLTPLIQQQINEFIAALPQIMNWVETTLMPIARQLVYTGSFKATLSSSLPKAGWIFDTVIKSGFTLVEWAVNIVLTPIVTFYLLRDWDLVRQNIKETLPKQIRPTIVTLAAECDEVLGAFFRGQLLVMLSLCFIYGIGLTLIGLQVGLIIGIVGGLLSIVPYLGSFFVVITASIAALVQYGDWHAVLWVLAVFAVGQTIESYFLTPYLVGERIGLHPVAVIFSVMAGGTLFDFFGVLVALPAAALIKVLFRFIRHQYHF
ncbi:AI-2E family transporter [Aquicella lusitana]|uniref:Putative PurR-regulated permease PerM n=1 Tax=Aquicella lusitana TaxID=254246 RepID=A0A370GNB0_9COXI|nr:AI-2E family transporter [Aquicella lusitana]RDI45157.1 putative PurR-regulated permease PerM [Aquicella lusitana]VVC72773.1 hypothetical protein AQULUS_04950 [Aquicella lusitana]